MHNDAPLADLRWIPFQPMFFAVPAYGVMVPNLAYGCVISVGGGQDLYRLAQPQGPQSDRFFYVNGPSDVASNGFGSCTPAIGQPVYAKYAPGLPSGDPAPNEIWGPLGTNDYQLYPGIPGFRVVGPADTARERVLVVRETGRPAFAKAISSWSSPTFTAHPVSDDQGTRIYDGTISGYPAATLTMNINCSGKINGRDWNVQAGDIFAYEIGDDLPGLPFLVPHARHLDDALGTIKIWGYPLTGISHFDIPPGWAFCDGIGNSGMSGLDMRGYFPVGVETRTGGSVPNYSDTAYTRGSSGGGKTHTHAGHGTTPYISAVSGSNNPVVDFGHVGHDSPDHRPPWRAITFIERVS